MNEQTPTWKCPVCNCPIPYQDLIVDGFFKDLLVNSSDSIQSVRINPSGELQHEFTVKEEESDGEAYEDEQEQTSSSAPVLSSSGGDSTEQSLPTGTTTTTTAATTATTTTTSTIPAHNSNNRPVVMVDLTLSDNE